MRVLVIGGTAFVGRHITNELLARGHEVVHFNRGVTGSAPEGIRTVNGDRTIGFDALADERFDAVVDTSGYVPHVVELSAQFFLERTKRYLFVSSVSVFDHSQERTDEDSPMEVLREGLSRTEMVPESYGALKALCEAVVASYFGSRGTIVRPGLVAGPFDPTDRFTYWPVRFARGGTVLAPGRPDRVIQFVDARDLAEFVVSLLERDANGSFNAASPLGYFTMGDLMGACASAAGNSTVLQWVPDAWLLERGVQAWTDLPLWIPAAADENSFYYHDTRRAVAAGLKTRPLVDTARDTLAWAQTRAPGYEARFGISPEREAELLTEPETRQTKP